MKAIVEIDLENLHKKGDSSYFTVKPGESLAEVMKKFDFSSEEIAEAETRILKGNPKWIELEGIEDKKKEVTATKEKQSFQERYDGLKALNKPEQLELLKKLGVEGKGVPAYEDDRIKLIIKLEKK